MSPTSLEIVDIGVLAVRDGTILWRRSLRSEDELMSLLELLYSDEDIPRPVSLQIAATGFFCPGMVDTHTHAPQYPNNGLGSELQLLDWLDKYTFPLEKRYSDKDLAKDAYTEVVRRTLAAGTTTSCYYATLHNEATWELARICEAEGQRALVGKCSMDVGNYSERNAFSKTREFIEEFPSTPDVQPILTPRFALSCSDGLLQNLGAYATEKDLRIQTHISENHAEIEEVKKRFGCTYAAAYDRFGLLTPRTILAHAVHLEPYERQIIKDRQCGISHCPTSNLHLNSGLCPAKSLLDQGIKVGLGSDCSGGSALGVLPQVRLAIQTSRALCMTGKEKKSLSIAEAFWMATRGGGEVAGFPVGNFEPGMRFDALHIKPRSPGLFFMGEDEPTTRELFEKWIWNGDDRDVERVWVNGEIVVKNVTLEELEEQKRLFGDAAGNGEASAQKSDSNADAKKSTANNKEEQAA